MKNLARRLPTKRGDEPSHPRDPFIEIGSVVITGSAIGSVLSIGLFLIVWEALPVVRPFLLSAIAVGIVFALTLWLKRR
jgi:hypothetical protein